MPEVGDYVFLMFQAGSATDYAPVWFPGPFADDGSPFMNQALPEQSSAGLKGAGFDDTGQTGDAVIPPSLANPGTYRTSYWKMKSGAMLEFDETAGEQRVQLYHPSGSHLEFHVDGTTHLVAANTARHQTMGSKFEFIQYQESKTIGMHRELKIGKKDTVTVGGAKKETIADGFTLTVGAEKVETISGGHEHTVSGNYDGITMGSWSQSIGTDFIVQATATAHVAATYQMSLSASNSVAQGGLPTDAAMDISAKNGRVSIASSDPTGLAMSAVLDLDGTLQMVDLSTKAAGVTLAGLGITTAGTIHLSKGPALTAVDPVVKGIEMTAFLTALITWMDTHVHPWAGMGGGITSPPMIPSATTLTGMVPTVLSTSVFVTV
jgi:hypothetical protein